MTHPFLSPGARHTSKFLWHDLVPIAACALTLVGVARLLLPGGSPVALTQVWAGFLPVGALLAGACAGSGFWIGARGAGRRPGVPAATVARAVGLLMYLVVCVPRAESGGAGTPVAAVSLDLSGLHHLTATGAAAYVLVILAGVGFAVGLTAVTRAPRGPVHCGRCRRYLPQNARRLASMPVCGADM